MPLRCPLCHLAELYIETHALCKTNTSIFVSLFRKVDNNQMHHLLKYQSSQQNVFSFRFCPITHIQCELTASPLPLLVPDTPQKWSTSRHASCDPFGIHHCPSTLLNPVCYIWVLRWSTQKYKYQEQRSSSGRLAIIAQAVPGKHRF